MRRGTLDASCTGCMGRSCGHTCGRGPRATKGRSPTCRGCGAPIEWGLTEAGKKVPLDPPEKRYVTGLQKGHYLIVETWTPHFATCSKRDDFRKTS